jgi:hypothetical protein
VRGISGEFVFFAFAVAVDDLPDRLTQLGVLERSDIRYRGFGEIGWRSNTFGPAFQDEQPALMFGAVEYLTGDSLGQVHVVENFSEFLDETNTQTTPKNASRITRGAGGLPLVIALFITIP